MGLDFLNGMTDLAAVFLHLLNNLCPLWKLVGGTVLGSRVQDMHTDADC